MKQTLRIRTATRIVCENRLSTTLPHVIKCIDDYLTGWISHEVLTAACEDGASEHTLEYIFGKTAPHWYNAVERAVRGGHLNILHWMTGCDDGRGPWKEDFDYVLELAATHGHLDAVKWFFERGIDSHTLEETEKNSKGFIKKCWLYKYCTAVALNLAAEHGHLEVVKWIHGARTDTCISDGSPISKAVANGHLAIAHWLHSVKAEYCSAGATNEAAENGHLEVLEWLDANQLFTCTWEALVGAAESGHLEVVKWLHHAHHECCSSLALGRAVMSGNLELVEWLYEHVHIKCYRYRTHRNVYLDTTTAAGRGHLDALKWTHEHFSYSFSSDEMDAAAKYGHMNVITWLHENRSEGCSKRAACNAARNAHLEVLKWLHTHYPNTFVPEVMDGAAENGHLEVVRWLHENRPEGCTYFAVESAASEGHFDILLYLLEHRREDFHATRWYNRRDIEVMCHFGSNARGNGRVTGDQLKMLQNVFERRPAFLQRWLRCLATMSCGRGNIAVLDWVNQFGMKLNSTEPICDAVHRGDVKMLQWFFDNGFEISDPDLFEAAVKDGQLEVVRWLSEHGYAVDSLELVKIAGKKCRNVPTMRWLVEHGPPLDLSTAMILVLENRHIEIAWWVTEKDRTQLVLNALQKDDREVVWWILVRTQFQDESAQRSIRDSVQCCPKDTQQWFAENMIEVEACRWCFSMAIKRQN